MRMPVLFVLVLLLVHPAVWGGDSPPTGADEVVLDAPGGRPVAILLSGAVRRTGEEREGFLRVTVEGWIRLPRTSSESGQASSSPPALNQASPPPSSMLPLPEPPATAVEGSGLWGQIRVTLPSREVRYGAGARVVLLAPVEDLDAHWAELKNRYEHERLALEKEIESLQRDQEGALSSSDNFYEASHRLERAKAVLAARQKDRQLLPAKYVSRLDELFQRYRVAEAAADPAGRYEIPNLVAGRYRLLATFTVGEVAHRWYLPLEKSSEGGLRFDLNTDDSGTDPYFGTR